MTDKGQLDSIKEKLGKVGTDIKNYYLEGHKYSGPDKAKITVLDADGNPDKDKEKYVQLNPNKIVLSDGVQYSNKKQGSKDTGERRISIGQYTKHKERTLTFELLFDTYTSLAIEKKKVDVKEEYIDDFITLITNPAEGSSPPMVRFAWSSIIFNGVITNMGYTYTMFTSTGTPVRATMNITINEYYFE